MQVSRTFGAEGTNESGFALSYIRIPRKDDQDIFHAVAPCPSTENVLRDATWNAQWPTKAGLMKMFEYGESRLLFRARRTGGSLEDIAFPGESWERG